MKKLLILLGLASFVATSAQAQTQMVDPAVQRTPEMQEQRVDQAKQVYSAQQVQTDAAENARKSTRSDIGNTKDQMREQKKQLKAQKRQMKEQKDMEKENRTREKAAKDQLKEEKRRAKQMK